MTYRHIMKCKRKRDEENPAPLHPHIPAHPAVAALHAAHEAAANNLEQNVPHQHMEPPVLQAAAHIPHPMHDGPQQANIIANLEQLIEDMDKDIEEAVTADTLNQLIPQPNQLPLPAHHVAGEAAAHLPLQNVQHHPMAEPAPQAAVQPPQQQVPQPRLLADPVLQQHNNLGNLAQLLENVDRELALAAPAQQLVAQVHQPAIPAGQAFGMDLDAAMDAHEEAAQEKLQGQEACLT